MPSDTINAVLRTEIEGLKAKGLYKAERRIESPQRSAITVNGREVVNFCANNYLGLANHPEIVAAAREGLTAGAGLSSVRFICGTQDVHKRLEQIAKFFRTRQHPLHLLLRRQRRYSELLLSSRTRSSDEPITRRSSTACGRRRSGSATSTMT